MPSFKLDKHIILIGFMGTGKTSIGKELALRLNLLFIDVDFEIEKSEGLSISEIFSTKGEGYFRNIEANIFKQLLDQNPPSIIATGGGIVLAESNRLLLKDYYTVLLKASIKEIYRRVREDSTRPLLNQGKDLLATIAGIYKQRIVLYEKSANYTVETDLKEIKEIVDEIIRYLNL